MNLVERAKRMLLTPKTEWEVVDAEPTTVSELYTQYIIPLAAIGPIAQVIGYALVGVHIPFSGVTYRTPIGRAVVAALIGYILSLIGVFILAMIIDMLAPSFGGTTDRLKALKVAAYSSTAMWLAAVFVLVPGLGILWILGLYSLYLLYLGLPVLMKAPQDKAGAYTVVVIVVGIVLFMVVSAVMSRVMVVGMY